MANDLKPTYAGLKNSDAQMLCLAEATGYQGPRLGHNQSGAEVVTGKDPVNGEMAGGSITRGPAPSVTGPYGNVTVEGNGATIKVEAFDPGLGPAYNLTVDAKSGATIAAKGTPRQQWGALGQTTRDKSAGLPETIRMERSCRCRVKPKVHPATAACMSRAQRTRTPRGVSLPRPEFILGSRKRGPAAGVGPRSARCARGAVRLFPRAGRPSPPRRVTRIADASSLPGFAADRFRRCVFLGHDTQMAQR